MVGTGHCSNDKEQENAYGVTAIREIDPNQWIYMAEGGRHVLYCYSSGKDDDDDDDDDENANDNKTEKESFAVKDNDDILTLSSMSKVLLCCVKQDLAFCALATKASETSDLPRNSTHDYVSSSSFSSLPPLPPPCCCHQEGKGNKVMTNNYVAAASSSSAASSFHYIQDLVRPRLGADFVDLPQQVRIPMDVAACLYHQAISSGKIPSHRLPSWQIHEPEDGEDSTTTTTTTGTGQPTPGTPGKTCRCCGGNIIIRVELIRDYRRSLTALPVPNNKQQHLQMQRPPFESCCWTVEIKPKAGYRPFSPLVHPNHRIKYTTSRFQLLHQQAAVADPQKEVTTPVTRSYDPRQLFSKDLDDIYSALSTLAAFRSAADLNKNKHNSKNHFFKVWKHRGKSAPALVPLSPLSANNDFSNGNNNNYYNDIPFGLLLQLVASILHREERFLSRLLSLQELDWIDADGAVFLYRLLVDKCDGSVASALSLIDEITPTATGNGNHGLKGNSQEANAKTGDDISSPASIAQRMMAVSPISHPFSLQRERDATPTSFSSSLQGLENLLAYIYTFRSKLDHDERLRHDEAFLDQAHDNCTNCLIPALSSADIVYLLQNWLLSLAMCDISFFVTMEMIQQQTEQLQERLQSQNSRGCLYYRPVRENDHSVGEQSQDGFWIMYSIKAIDCDAKPCKKLATRHVKEQVYTNLSNRSTDPENSER